MIDLDELAAQRPFQDRYIPLLVKRWGRCEFDEEHMSFYETKLIQWDMQYRIWKAGCRDLEQLTKLYMLQKKGAIT